MGLFNWAKNKSARMVGFKQIKEDSKLIYNSFKAIENQSADDAEEKLDKLDKKIIEEKKASHLKYSKLALLVFAIIFAFVIYKICKQDFFAAISIFIVSLIPLIQALKYHYWYTILKQKKLLTVKDYLNKFKAEIK